MRLSFLLLILLAFMLASGCQTAEPLPEVMSDAEYRARMDAIEAWRTERMAECPEDDADCRHAVLVEYLEKIEALFDARIAQVEARLDAQRRR